MQNSWTAFLGLAFAATLLTEPLAANDKAKAVATAQATTAQIEQQPPIIPTATFVDRGYLRGPIISPDGQRLVFREYIGKKTFVGIKPVDGKSITRIGLPEKHTLNWYRWAGDDHLLISVTGVGQLFGEEVPISGLVGYNVKTGISQRLGRERQGLSGDDILFVDPKGDYLLMAVQKSIYEYPGIYQVGISDNALTEIVKPQSEIWNWYADDQGVVRMGLAYADRATKIYYRRSNDEKFKLISKIKESDSDEKKEEELIDLTRIVSGKDEGYVLSNKETGRFALYKFNYLTRETGDLVYGHPENDISSFSLTDDGSALESVRYTDSRDRIHWFDPLYQKRQKALETALPGEEAWMQSRSRDGSKLIVFTTSPTDPGSYALFEPKAGKLDRFALVNEQLDPKLLATTKYVRYPARDGLEIPAYLTLPVGRTPKALPLIILPHGGPFGVRDTLDYSNEVQFLANRGYAVLQPNFRGSDTYGEEYYKRGEGQIGRAMQDDLDDGMDWLVKDGIVDRARVCIVGTSYGGYAAMWGVIRNPERYRCAASFAGVTDFKSQLKYDGKSLKSRYAREWRDKVQGQEDFDLDTVSPAKNAAKLSRPLLITHGDQDSNVPYSQFKKMTEALKKAKISVDSHIYKGEGHGFEDSENEKDWLDRLEAFLAKHNPADVNLATPPAPSPKAP
jgi:dipeptidyl aminopeptidase/acylaminoacyl peptidase